MWDHLAKHWNLYGKTRLLISFQKDFTLESLTRAGPDVIVCSDPAGAPYQYTKREIEDLVTYLREGSGRHLLGTYASFFHQEGSPANPHIYDNRALAGLFGLNPLRQYTTKKLAKQPKLFPTEAFRHSMLWANMQIPYVSYGYSSTQLICENGEPQHWLSRKPRAGAEEAFFASAEARADACVSVLLDDDFSSFLGSVGGAAGDACGKESCLQGGLGNVRVLAHTEDNMVVVTNYVCATFTSVYISHMPEYESLKKSHTDAQFFYNTFCFLVAQNSTVSLRDRCLDILARSLGDSRVFGASDPAASLQCLPAALRARVHAAARMTGQYSSKQMQELFLEAG